MTRTAAARTPATKIAAAAIALTLPELAKGEVYAGILIKDGKPMHHLVLLPGDEKKNWKDAGAWAKKHGGELPTRKEQALLFANASGKLEAAWYWSSETHASDAAFAWNQYFGNGYQLSYHKGNDSRCRAVRRVAI